MLIKDLAQAVHENAVAHGWWDEERPFYSVVALIHSEWSEALEEARAGNPPVYKIITLPFGEAVKVTPNYECYSGCDGKPEGVAVELIDGCIRILDAIGQYQDEEQLKKYIDGVEIEDLWRDEFLAPIMENDIVCNIAVLHAMTSQAVIDVILGKVSLVHAMGRALALVCEMGIDDPLKLLMEKHEYNKTRPYKHGKRF